jgi:hypothetical protein
MESPDHGAVTTMMATMDASITNIAFPVLTRVFKWVLINFSFGAASFQDFIFELERTPEHLGPPAHSPGCFHIFQEVIGMKKWQSTVTVAIHDGVVDGRIGLCYAFKVGNNAAVHELENFIIL